MSDSEDESASVQALHPRIRERRQEVQVASLRTRNRKLIAAGVLILLGLLVAAATQSALFDVDEVRVVGAQRNAPEYFRQAAAVQLGAPLLGLDTTAIEERLEELPEVQGATATTSWRGVVTVEVNERLPVARIETADGTVLIAEDGIVIEVLPAPIVAPSIDTDDPAADGATSSDGDTAAGGETPDDGEAVSEELVLPPDVEALPEISGAIFSIDAGERVPAVLGDALSIASTLPADIAVITDRVEITVDSLVLRVVGGGAISLGDARDSDEKFEAIRAFLTQVDLRCLDTLNVAAPTVPVIVRNTNC